MSIFSKMTLFASQPDPGSNNSAAADLAATSELATDRYPKRKRHAVVYDFDDDEDEFLLEDDEWEQQPSKKVKISPKTAKKLPKNKIFPFMQLPPELRNKIYECALSDMDEGTYIISRSKGYRRLAQRSTETACEPQFNNRNRWRRRWRYLGLNRDDKTDNDEEQAVQQESLIPNLLATNKAIYSEAVSLLYGQPFVLADNYALMAFLTQIGHRNIQLLRHITVNQWCGGRSHKSINFAAMSMLAPATSLRQLNIATAVGWFHSYSWRGGKSQVIAKRVARQVFRDCYAFLEAYGSANGSMAAAVDLIDIDENNFERGGDELEGEIKVFKQELQRLLEV